MDYSFHPAAEAEFLEAVGYYESKVSGLGGTLIQEFHALAISHDRRRPQYWIIRL